MKPHEIKGALIELRQSDSEYSPLAKHTIKRLDTLTKQLDELRLLCGMMHKVINTTRPKEESDG